MVSKRAWLKLFDDRIECGDWTVPYSEIDEVVLYKAKDFVIPALVLKLTTKDNVYQFGINPWCKIAEYLPISFREEKSSLGYSWLTTILRIAILCYLLYWTWDTWIAT